MNRSYYSDTVWNFLNDDSNLILGKLSRNHQFALEDLQRNSWISQIDILKSELRRLPDSFVAFEYAIPRMGKRVDVIIIYSGIIFVLEFKVGETTYSNFAIEQVLDYAKDLKYFHEQSHSSDIVPILVATEATDQPLSINKYEDGLYHPLKANKDNFSYFGFIEGNEIMKGDSNVIVTDGFTGNIAFKGSYFYMLTYIFYCL